MRNNTATDTVGAAAGIRTCIVRLLALMFFFRDADE